MGFAERAVPVYTYTHSVRQVARITYMYIVYTLRILIYCRTIFSPRTWHSVESLAPLPRVLSVYMHAVHACTSYMHARRTWMQRTVHACIHRTCVHILYIHAHCTFMHTVHACTHRTGMHTVHPCTPYIHAYRTSMHTVHPCTSYMYAHTVHAGTHRTCMHTPYMKAHTVIACTHSTCMHTVHAYTTLPAEDEKQCKTLGRLTETCMLSIANIDIVNDTSA